MDGLEIRISIVGLRHRNTFCIKDKALSGCAQVELIRIAVCSGEWPRDIGESQEGKEVKKRKKDISFEKFSYEGEEMLQML